jgi:hypothetical protein
VVSATIELTWVGRAFFSGGRVPVDVDLLYQLVNPARDSIRDAPLSGISGYIRVRDGSQCPRAQRHVRFEALNGMKFVFGLREGGAISVERWLD